VVGFDMISISTQTCGHYLTGGIESAAALLIALAALE